MDGNGQATALRFAHVALPADAIDGDPWVWHADAWRRFFLTMEWNVGEIWVSVAGEQTGDGKVRRWMVIGGEAKCTSSDRRALIAAIDEARRLLDSLE